MFQEDAFAARMVYRAIGEALEIQLESASMNANVSVPTVAPGQVSIFIRQI